MNMLFFILALIVIVLGSINLIRMALFLIGSDIYGVLQTLEKKRARERQPYTPRLSVVIPAHNEEHTIENTVLSVLTADYPEDLLEVVIVDDGSTDSTTHIVRSLIATHPNANLRLVKQKNAGKAHALNNGMRNYSTGEFIMCLDADSSIAHDALRNAVRYFEDIRVVALSSNVKIRPTDTLLNLIQQFEYLVCYQMKRAQTLFNIEYIIGGIGSTFRRSALESVGYYDTDTITEDIDLTFKLIHKGNKSHRAIYGSDVVTYTESVLTLNDLIKQRFRWKHGRSQTFLKNTSMFFSCEKKHNKLLTWAYLPYAIFSDIAFFLEPLVLTFILYTVFAYADWVTLLSAFVVVGTYITLNVLAEDTIPWRRRIFLAFIAPTMYGLFYILSYVEYVALLKSYSRARELVRKERAHCSWDHVSRVAPNTT